MSSVVRDAWLYSIALVGQPLLPAERILTVT